MPNRQAQHHRLMTSRSSSIPSVSSLDALEINSVRCSSDSFANSIAKDAAVKHSKLLWSFRAISAPSASSPARRPRSNSSDADGLEKKRIARTDPAEQISSFIEASSVSFSSAGTIFHNPEAFERRLPVRNSRLRAYDGT
jgi:hypothetical protein